ncbi:hypothetical protein SELR_04230 [Selenomonas ruminantium subsp. lactilytica TAM6421]|uniref:Uncharacterized protein n=1 Tax=Selenomonas ruminantium subsp. lactilytica (strain NBRC 103574 / TAM6421) TaxID=927704 RepID=I0GMZ4_SELRL|nr:hypothetical protein SELR_04230 [Selenomonas ruminantium subsp. lactilytica TAM6421]
MSASGLIACFFRMKFMLYRRSGKKALKRFSKRENTGKQF